MSTMDSLINRLGTWRNITIGEIATGLTSPSVLANIAAMVVGVIAARFLMRPGVPAAIAFSWSAPEVCLGNPRYRISSNGM